MNERNTIAERLLQLARDGHEPSPADEARVRSSLRAKILANPLLLSQVDHFFSSASKAVMGRALVALTLCGVATVAVIAFRRPEPRMVSGAGQGSRVGEARLQPIAPGDATTVQKTDLLEPTVLAPAPSAANRGKERRPAFVNPSSAGNAPAASDLQLELSGLRHAQQLLHGGRAAQAVVVLDDLTKQVPSGALLEERAATRAIALCSLGQRGPANETEFLKQFPASVHASGVRRACTRATSN
jgi:hypothetical protein